jgi:hypothetical protein
VLLGQEKRPAAPNFGALQASSEEAVKGQAQAWLKESGKSDAAVLARFETIWNSKGDLVDRVEQTLALGNPQAAKLLADARDLQVPAPTKVPEILTNDKNPAFLRSNLALAYARLLIQRRVYEEALAALKVVRTEEVADPASYLFHEAVCEHGLLQKEQAGQSINRLIEDVAAAPERYKTVAVLMLLDMQAWKEKDLGEVARKMENVERRLDLARGGPQTQKLQKEILRRLDEIIKELENKKKGSGDGNDGNCPNGKPGNAPGGGNNPNSPMPDSVLPNQGGMGDVTQAKLRKLKIEWGQLPPAQRQQMLQDLTASMSSAHREAIENYFRNLAQLRK